VVEKLPLQRAVIAKHDGCMLREETKKIGATAMFSWKAKLTTLIPLKRIKKELKPTLSKHGINEFIKVKI
jgi:hypothetical protein